MKPILTPNVRQLEWFARDKTAFFHFGMNTYSDREWGDGTEDPARFHPTELDCMQWVRTVKEAGFDAAILTAKHHDGFCLWPSAYTEHSVKNSPYRNGQGDIVREFTDACRAYGVKAGIYLSPWDRHEKTWGSEAYNDFYVGQLTELLTNYGEIWECWWDGAGSTKTHYDWERWADTVRRLQPNAVIFGSLGASPYVDVRWVGNEKGIAGKPCYPTVDLSVLEVETTSLLNSGQKDGAAFIPAEADVSVRPGWFYHGEQDTDVRTPHNLVNLWFASRGRGAGLLLNLPPDRRGLLADADIAALGGFHSILSHALGRNFAKGCKITAPEAASHGHAKDALLSTDRTAYYEPESREAEIIVELSEACTFNMFTLSEAIEHGCRVERATVEVEDKDGWRRVAETVCVGNLFSERIEPVTAKRVRICVQASDFAPRLRNFGLFRIDEPDPETTLPLESYNLLTRKNVVVERMESGWDINLGGIYPFNQLRLDTTGIKALTIEVFNGTDFELVDTVETTEGEHLIYRFPNVVDGSYRIRVIATKHTPAFNTTHKPKLYLVK